MPRVSASCINQVIEMDYWKRMAIIGFVMMVVFIIGFLGILYLLYRELTAKKRSGKRVGDFESLKPCKNQVVALYRE
uniref:Wsv460 n=1 Tax=Strongyloides venezuelensis TaxID=75913 RepID=A0A0K0FPL4_STRVS